MFGMLASLSRGSWISTALGLCTLLFWAKWRERRFWPVVSAVVGSLLVFAVVAWYVPAIHDYISKTFTPATQQSKIVEDPTLGGRSLMMYSTWQLIREKPLFGTGPASWQYEMTRYRHPHFQDTTEFAHNDVLNLISDYGIVGLLLVMGALFFFYRHAVHVAVSRYHSEQRAFAIGAIVSVTAILVHSWFDFNMHIPANSLLLVTIMAFTMAIGDPSDQKLRKEMPAFGRFGLAGAIGAVVAAAVIFVVPATQARLLAEKAIKAREFYMDDQGAITLYQKALAHDPKMPDAYTQIGEIQRNLSFWRVGDDKKAERLNLATNAIEAYLGSLKLNPLQSIVEAQLGSAYSLAENTNAAITAFNKAIELDPNNYVIYRMQGKFYSNIGDDTNAIIAFEKASQFAWGIKQSTHVLNLMELRSRTRKE
jgi:hypothetical protein